MLVRRCGGCGGAAAAAGPRTPVLRYGPEVIEALRVCWAALDGPAGKRLAPALPQLVASLRRHGELDIDDEHGRLLQACQRPRSTGGSPRTGRRCS